MSATTTEATTAEPAVEAGPLPEDDDWRISFIKTEFRLFVDSQHIVKDIDAYTDTLSDCAADLQLGDLLHEQEKLHQIENSQRVITSWLRERIVAEHQARA